MKNWLPSLVKNLLPTASMVGRAASTTPPAAARAAREGGRRIWGDGIEWPRLNDRRRQWVPVPRSWLRGVCYAVDAARPVALSHGMPRT